jgi:predicted AAA+ superfamily ATPase
VDSALATRLARVTTDQLQRLDHGEAFGGLLEGFVGAELLRQQTWTAQEFQLFHYRDRDGLEVDFVLELTGGQVIAIEVKGSTSFNRNQFHGLREIRERCGDRFIAGIVLNTGPTGYRYGDRLYGLPVDALWSL